MGKARIVLGLAGILLLSGCPYVKESDFEARMKSVQDRQDSVIASVSDRLDRVKASGVSVNAWIAETQAFHTWLKANMNRWCSGCDPKPPPPPDPPPDPDWGG